MEESLRVTKYVDIYDLIGICLLKK